MIPRVVENRASWTARIVTGLAVFLLAGCGGVEQFPQTSLEPRSDYAIAIDNLWNLTLWMGVGVGIIVFMIIAYIMVRFRYREGAPEPKQMHGNTRLCLLYTSPSPRD